MVSCHPTIALTFQYGGCQLAIQVIGELPTMLPRPALRGGIQNWLCTTGSTRSAGSHPHSPGSKLQPRSSNFTSGSTRIFAQVLEPFPGLVQPGTRSRLRATNAYLLDFVVHALDKRAKKAMAVNDGDNCDPNSFRTIN